jgi:hypothetical protein
MMSWKLEVVEDEKCLYGFFFHLNEDKTMGPVSTQSHGITRRSLPLLPCTTAPFAGQS